jgi:hypothetical protein
MIADWGPDDDSSAGIYLIERVGDRKGDVVPIDFRALRDWKLYENDHRSDAEGCNVREPTDEECAIIAKNRLLRG